MADVSGAPVTPDRYALMPSSTTDAAGTLGRNVAMLWPMPAPTASAGEKIPPGMPAQYDTTLASSLAMPKV